MGGQSKLCLNEFWPVFSLCVHDVTALNVYSYACVCECVPAFVAGGGARPFGISFTM